MICGVPESGYKYLSNLPEPLIFLEYIAILYLTRHTIRSKIRFGFKSSASPGSS